MDAQNVPQCRTLTDVIVKKACSSKGITFIGSADDETFISYAELYSRALRILKHLQDSGIHEGDELVFQLNHNETFLLVFWACMLGKIVAVPLTAAYIERHRQKLFNICQDLKRPHLIISRSDLKGLESYASTSGNQTMYQTMCRTAIFVEEAMECSEEGTVVYPDERDLAFIQFSSGSTSQPKGVMLTHRNLLCNIHALANGLKPTAGGERVLSWMPLTHDMGLIALHLMSAVKDWSFFLMPTRLFTRHPGLWLQKISHHKITLTGSPNSGFQHVLRFCDLDKEKDVDLSSLRIILNGAEPISAELCTEFSRQMAVLGLAPEAILPCYGLAEASVAVTLTDPATEFVPIYVERDSIHIGETVSVVENGAPGCVTFVICGLVVDHCKIRVVGPENQVLPEKTVGYVQISGENVTSGYYRNKEKTAEAFTPDGWVNTGDLGFIWDGQLVITGRVKDTIIIQGNTFFAHDIEFICQEIEDLKYSKVAVCGIYNSETQSDEIVCFVSYKKQLESFSEIADAVKKRIVKKAGVPVLEVLPVKTIPTTTSGKVQRYQLRTRYLGGEFEGVREALSLL